MRQARILVWVMGGCLLVFGVLVLTLRLLVDPNRYKPRISAAVKAATGRELQLSGDIHWSVFPQLALEMGPASLGNPPGFEAVPFVSFTHAAIRVKLLPLLRERLEIARVEIDGMDLRLLENAQGQGNWQSVRPSSTAQAPAADSNRAVDWLQSLADIKIRQGRVRYQHFIVEHLELETGALTAQRLVPLSLAFDANRGIVGEQIVVSAHFAVGAEAAPAQAQHDQVQVAAINLGGTVSWPGDGRPVHWEVTAPMLAVDLTQQTLSMPAFAMSYSSGRVTGNMAATLLGDAPRVTGSLNLGPLVLQEFAPRLGFQLPKTRDAKALASLSGSTDFAYDARGLSLERMLLRVDASELKGRVQVTGAESPAVRFDLQLDQIDLERYLSPVGATPAAADPAPGATTRTAKPPAVDGTLRIGSVKLAPFDFTDLAVTVASQDAVTHLSPLVAAIDGGRFSGDVTYDAHAAPPTLTLDAHLTDVDLLRLLANTPQRGRLSGRATVDLKARANGSGADAWLPSLDGHVDAHLAQGAIEGVDVSYEIGVAQALLERQAPAAREDSRRTAFDVCSLSAQITHGLAQTHDLAISSALLKVTGQGTVSLPSKGIHLALDATVFKSPTVTAIEVPLTVTGSYLAPIIRPDTEALVKGQLKQKLNDVLEKNGLKGLFGR